MQKEFVSFVFASLIIFAALAATEGVVPARMAEIGIIVLPVLAVAAIQPGKCCRAIRGVSA